MIYVFTLTCRRSIFWLGRANLSNLLPRAAAVSAPLDRICLSKAFD